MARPTACTMSISEFLGMDEEMEMIEEIEGQPGAASTEEIAEEIASRTHGGAGILPLSPRGGGGEDCAGAHAEI